MIELNYTIFIEMAIFIALVLILNKLLYQPIFRILDERKRVVEGGIASAESMREEAQRLFAEYEERLVAARQQAVKIVNEAKVRAQEEQKEALAKVRKEFEETLASLKEQLEREKEEAREKLRQTVNVLAILISEKILGRKLEGRV